jgi:hypothetical protein
MEANTWPDPELPSPKSRIMFPGRGQGRLRMARLVQTDQPLKDQGGKPPRITGLVRIQLLRRAAQGHPQRAAIERTGGRMQVR